MHKFLLLLTLFSVCGARDSLKPRMVKSGSSSAWARVPTVSFDTLATITHYRSFTYEFPLIVRDMATGQVVVFTNRHGAVDIDSLIDRLDRIDSVLGGLRR